MEIPNPQSGDPAGLCRLYAGANRDQLLQSSPAHLNQAEKTGKCTLGWVDDPGTYALQIAVDQVSADSFRRTARPLPLERYRNSSDTARTRSCNWNNK